MRHGSQMSDPLDFAATGGAAISSAGLVGLLMRALLGRQQTEVATRLAVIEQQLAHLVAAAAKTEGLGERVALLEASNAAIYERLDRNEKRRR